MTKHCLTCEILKYQRYHEDELLDDMIRLSVIPIPPILASAIAQRNKERARV